MAKGGRDADDEGGEVREMRSAETVLAIIHDRGKRGLPLEDVLRRQASLGKAVFEGLEVGVRILAEAALRAAGRLAVGEVLP